MSLLTLASRVFPLVLAAVALLDAWLFVHFADVLTWVLHLLHPR